ncbi:MAG: LD-carboxypeptidase [Eubacterium sp.]|nr:LD-carboxypeptidase [Eubacterium sp.]
MIWTRLIFKKRLKVAVSAMLISAVLAGCGSTVENKEGNADTQVVEETVEESKIFSEGVDTPIEVTGYASFKGTDADFFLKAGDKVAVISPSALPSRAQADAVIKGLTEWGYVPVEGKYVCTENRTLDNCKEDLEWALSDPEIKGIFCVRGGYASCEVLEALDRKLIARAKKPIIGYSDITACLSAWTREGIPSIHASMSAAFTDLPEECREVERKMLQGEIPKYKCTGSGYDRQGTAEGILVGGNVTIMMTVANTDFDCTKIDQPYILFLEDVECDYHQVHYGMTVLKNSGILENASGIILGEWIDTDPEPGDYIGDSRGGKFSSVYDMIYRQFLKDLDVPIAYGFPGGHGEKNYPLLMGENVRLTVTEDSFTLEWPDAN